MASRSAAAGPSTSPPNSLPRRWLALAVLGLWLGLAPTPTSAHVANLSTSRLDVAAGGIRQVIDVHRVDLEAALGRSFGDEGTIVEGAIVADPEATRAYLLANARLLDGEGRDCEVAPDPPRHVETHVVATATWHCPAGGRLRYRVTLFHATDPNARHLVLIFRGEGEPIQGLLNVGQPEIALDAPAAWHQVARRHVVFGIEHIAIGFDHIAFLLALILWARRFWPFVVVVTAFTLAHSITLALAVLEVASLPGAGIEIAIAATIVYAAAENLFSRAGEKRWRTAFVLGLLHGFGFASVLRDFGLPRDHLVLALAAFNIGVEIGQMIIVAAAFAVLLGLDRALARGDAPARSPLLVYTLSLPILALGVYWLIERAVSPLYQPPSMAVGIMAPERGGNEDMKP